MRRERTHLRWFGTSWKASVCAPETKVPTPVGKRCSKCQNRIVLGDQGLVVPILLASREPGATSAWHRSCWFDDPWPGMGAVRGQGD